MCSARSVACCVRMGRAGSIWVRLTLLVVTMPAGLPCFGVLLHVAPMTEHFQILKPLVVFVTISVVNAKPRQAPVVTAMLAPPNPTHKSSRRLCRQPVIAGMRISPQHLLSLRFPAILSPPCRDLASNTRTLAAPHLWPSLARKSRRHRGAMLVRPMIRRLALAALLRSRRHWLSARRAGNLLSRHVVAPIARE